SARFFEFQMSLIPAEAKTNPHLWRQIMRKIYFYPSAIYRLILIAVLMFLFNYPLAARQLNPTNPGSMQSNQQDEVKQLNIKVVQLYQAGKYDEAIPLAKQALAIGEKTLSAEHRDVADSLNNLALLYASKGDYVRAEPLYQRALAIYEKVLG